MVKLVAVGWEGAKLSCTYAFQMATPEIGKIREVLDRWGVSGKNGVVVDSNGYWYVTWTRGQYGQKKIKDVSTLVKGWEKYAKR